MSDEKRVDAQRRRFDVRERALQHDLDTDRDALRAVHDRTRNHVRGGQQSHQSLDRERRSADEAVDAQRKLTVEQRDAERSLMDRSMRNAEDALDGGSIDQGRTEALVASVAAARARVRLIATHVAGVLEDPEPRARLDAMLREVEALGDLLDDALDPGDARGLRHDVGGSG